MRQVLLRAWIICTGMLMGCLDQMRLFRAAMLAERLALPSVVMRKWQGSAWRANEAARPHTSLR